MIFLVVGATGMTGRLVVEQLLAKNHSVRVIVRSSRRLPSAVLENPNASVLEARVLDLTDEEMVEQVDGCDAVLSCLGRVIDCDEQRSWIDRGLFALLRHALPPHRDNETAAEVLRRHPGKQSGHVEWCSVRPDSLIDAEVSAYDIEESPTTGILTGCPAARSNVAHFMTELVENAEHWNTWKFRVPVVMNARDTTR